MTTGEIDFDNASTLFAEIVLPVPIPKFFTYRIPAHFNNQIKIGQRAIVQFGQKKILTGVIAKVHNQPPREYEAKYVLELLDENEVVYSQQFELYYWISEYYMCTAGEVFNAALPSGLKLSSESMVQLNPSLDLEDEGKLQSEFSQKEQVLIHQLRNGTLTYTDVAKLLGTKSIYAIVKSLTAKGAILLFEQVKEKFKPRTEVHVRLTAGVLAKKKLEKTFEELAAKPKQEAVVLKYLQEVPVFNHPELNAKGILRSKLLEEGLSASSLTTLIKNKVFEEFDVVVPRFGFEDSGTGHPILLSEHQQQAKNEILTIFEQQQTALLHGVTGSGKTEIYIDLIRKALDSGTQVLYLLPEIALTTQIVHRLKKIFGATMGVYHSRFSDNERVEVWNGVLGGKFKFVVGVRSSVFLPFDNLGLIIVDEEHDGSYKQHDPAPRYHARDVAMVMARIHHAKVLLGSATPSLESFYQVARGHYGLVTLTERFGEARLPEVIFVDLLKEKQRKTNKGEFSSVLLQGIRDTVARQDQVILFQNRRGYSPMVQCQDCGWIPKCINCSVSLTYHQYRHAMICHYCGYREELPKQCPVCSSARILTKGYGTEKLEEELKLHFPDATTERMDLDTTRSKSGYESILEGFESGKTNILVGTQMVTKGLDFDRVSLVGVFDADRMMHFPDFRSYERAFQLIVQVSGRAGRRATQGKVIIQTTTPEHPVFSFVRQHDIKGFAEEQMRDREEFFFPPFSRLIEVTVRHTDPRLSLDCATRFLETAKTVLKGLRIQGPAEPMISKIRNEYLRTILIKIPRDQGKLGEIKSTLTNVAEQTLQQKEFRSARIVMDVDPV